MEVIIIDDKSDDNSCEIIKKNSITPKKKLIELN
jgi:glycosyltransferase involved in cell wall biosynthesis